MKRTLTMLWIGLWIAGCGASSTQVPLLTEPSQPLLETPEPMTLEASLGYPELIRGAAQVSEHPPFWAHTAYSPRPDPDPIRSCLEGRHTPACFLAARAVEHGQGALAKNEQVAAQTYFELCNEGVAPACLQLGVLSLRGFAGVPADLDMGLWNLWRACRLGEPSGCAEIGALVEESDETPRQLEVAAHFYQYACAGGTLAACERFAMLSLRRAGDAPPREVLREAASTFRSACWRGLLSSCWRHGYLEASGALQPASEPGEDPDAITRAVAAVIMPRPDSTTLREVVKGLGRACEARPDPQVCLPYAMAIKHGEGATRDPEAAHALFTSACRLEEGPAERFAACSFEAVDVADGQGGVEADPARAAGLFAKACDGGYAPACNDLGLITLRENVGGDGEETAAKIAEGLALIRGQCAAKESWVCLRLLEFCVEPGLDSACRLLAPPEQPTAPPLPDLGEKSGSPLEGCEAYARSDHEAYVYCDGSRQVPTLVVQALPPAFTAQPIGAIVQAAGFPEGSEVVDALNLAMPNLAVSLPPSPPPLASTRFTGIMRQPAGYSMVSCVGYEALDTALCRARIERLVRGFPRGFDADTSPASVQVLGRPISLDSSCRLIAPNSVECERAGQMNWWVAEDMESAKARRDFQLEENRKAPNNESAIDVLLDTTIECRLNGEPAECGRLKLKIVSPGQFTGTLEVYHGLATFGDEKGLAICRFYSGEQGSGKLPPVCEGVFELLGE